MQEFQKRVVEEKKSLDEKINRLSPFIGGDIYSSLSLDEQQRLDRQLEVMSEYSSILGARIGNFQD